MKNRNDYETCDLAFAAFLTATGHARLKDIRGNDGSRKTFIFDCRPPQDIILRFYNGSEKVSAIKLIESYQRLKSACYIVRSNGG